MTEEGSAGEWEAAGPSSRSKDIAALVHVSSLSGIIVPFGGVIGPLVVWSLNKERSELIDDHGRAAVNFNISMHLYSIIAFLVWLVFFLNAPGPGVMVMAFVFAALSGLFWLILVVVNALRASKGEWAEYVLAIPFFGR